MTTQVPVPVPVPGRVPAATSRIGFVAAVVVGGTAGFFAWAWCAGFDGKREGWDDPRWFTVALPALAVLCLVLGYLMPVRAWRWGVAPMVIPAALMILADPEGPSLMPLGLVIFALTFLGLAMAASLGAVIRRRQAASG